MIDEEDNEFLASNIKGLMMSLVSKWNEHMDIERAESEFAKIRPSDMRIFGYLRGASVPLSSLHVKHSISRQAVHQSMRRLVEHDLIRLDPMPGNQRDKIVVITEKGQRRRTLAAQQIRTIEKECATVIGTKELEQLRLFLIQLLGKTALTPEKANLKRPYGE